MKCFLGHLIILWHTQQFERKASKTKLQNLTTLKTEVKGKLLNDTDIKR